MFVFIKSGKVTPYKLGGTTGICTRPRFRSRDGCFFICLVVHADYDGKENSDEKVINGECSNCDGSH